MPTATEIIKANALAQYSQMCWPVNETPTFTGEDIEDYYIRLMEDFCDAYEADWFALIATKSIRKTIDWDSIAKAITEMVAAELAD